MQHYTRRMVTIVTESALERTLVAELESLGVRGFTITDAPVVKLLQSMFEDAVQVNASDIHIDRPELRQLHPLVRPLTIHTGAASVSAKE